ncbi:DUF2147 domain-containing protein [Mangrovicella endophytica]|uniref:DUF2147 domain-containing protein n=1 Tax=Mangrovicella endophytica TaxID=2066697 RepID=UPI000C9EB0C2|nr:DUF2147 domain-containing protein [Mangrovicella endophytica]
MTNTVRGAAAAIALMLMPLGAALADPIEGNWKMPSGYAAKIAPCSGGYCLTYTSGPFAGKQFGKMQRTGDNAYKGTVTDYTKGGKEYSGKGKIDGGTLSVSGCVLGGLICRSQSLTRL